MPIPISDPNITFAPSSTFAGLDVYNKHGKPEARLVWKEMRWTSGVRSANGRVYEDGSSYSNVLTDDKQRIAARPTHMVYARWADLKNRIVLDASPEKLAEDVKLRQEALNRQ